MFISKSFKTIGCAILPFLFFSQTAMAAPSSIIFQNPSGQIIQADYLMALSNAPMKTALSNNLSACELANLPIFVIDTNGSVINYAAAFGKGETYATALNDSIYNHATAPQATLTMGADGTLTASAFTVPGIQSVSPIQGTIALGGTTGFTFVDTVEHLLRLRV